MADVPALPGDAANGCGSLVAYPARFGGFPSPPFSG